VSLLLSAAKFKSTQAEACATEISDDFAHSDQKAGYRFPSQAAISRSQCLFFIVVNFEDLDEAR
jgi:hypothetical protein